MKSFARLIQKRDFGQLVDELLQGVAIVEHIRFEVLFVDRRIAEDSIGETGGMLQQIVHGRVPPHRLELYVSLLVFTRIDL